jgi:hypothetical protein
MTDPSSFTIKITREKCHSINSTVNKNGIHKGLEEAQTTDTSIIQSQKIPIRNNKTYKNR